MNLDIKLLTATATIPSYAHASDACFDLYADRVDSDPEAYYEDSLVIGTGVAINIPEGWCLMIYSRSGMGINRNTRLANCVGIIDSGYQGEIIVKLKRDDAKPLTVNVGDRVAQAQLCPVVKVLFNAVEEFEATDRGENGLGSSGQ